MTLKPPVTPKPLARAQETADLVSAVSDLIVKWIQAADSEVSAHQTYQAVPESSLVDVHCLEELEQLLSLSFPRDSLGRSGFLSSVRSVLKYSVNTFSPGFLDKLVACTNPVGLASDLLLSALNTNLHVYRVSPALTAIEKKTTKELARLFGLDQRYSGGISVQGGSASNLTSLVVARNTLFPGAKRYGFAGLAGRCQQPVLFASVRAHYSFEKAAQVCGLGSDAVIAVPVDSLGRMIPSELERLVDEAISRGKSPFYVAATAGTTVLGAFDPLQQIAGVTRSYGLWFHVDAAWGGGFVFSDTLKADRLRGTEMADSISFNPHKMLGVPATCSFLLARDLRQFHASNSLPAGYLFHAEDDSSSARSPSCVSDQRKYRYETNITRSLNADLGGSGCEGFDSSTDQSTTSYSDSCESANASASMSVCSSTEDSWIEPEDLGDLTLQCGRRGDSLKLYLSLQYYGTNTYALKVERAYQNALYTASRLSNLHKDNILLVSPMPVPCLQVCFYYAPKGEPTFGPPAQKPVIETDDPNSCANNLLLSPADVARCNSQVTRAIAKELLHKGFMIDYAPASEAGQSEWYGEFFRLVIHIETMRETVDRLIDEILAIGKRVVLLSGKACPAP